MKTRICDDEKDLGRRAAVSASAVIRGAIEKRGRANVVFATGTSQLQTLEALVADETIDWSLVTGFHLDEYLGLSAEHPASLRRYLKDNLVDRVPFAAFHFVNGEAENPAAECERLGALLEAHPIDVALVGIGENGHLAFNDPPADFATDRPFLVVELDEACRQQQVAERWFDTLDAVPARAITMAIPQILDARAIVVSVPGPRKAEAVQATVEGPVTAELPASILQDHDRTVLYLDRQSASALTKIPEGALPR